VQPAPTTPQPDHSRLPSPALAVGSSGERDGALRLLGKPHGPSEWVRVRSCADGVARGVLQVIAGHSDRTGACYLRLDTIEEESGFRNSTIRKALERLVQLSELEKSDRRDGYGRRAGQNFVLTAYRRLAAEANRSHAADGKDPYRRFGAAQPPSGSGPTAVSEHSHKDELIHEPIHELVSNETLGRKRKPKRYTDEGDELSR
jgi:hypothetical protein